MPAQRSTDLTLRDVGNTSEIDLAWLIDRVAIEDVVNAYAVLFDTGQFDSLATLFTRDAEYSISPAPPKYPSVMAGNGVIASSLARLFNHNKNNLQILQRHIVTNIVVRRISGHEAEASSYVTAVVIPRGTPPEIVRAGVYEDHLRKEDGRWKIARRRLILDVPDDVETSSPQEGVPAANP